LVVGTDGLVEAKNSEGHMFGYQRFLTLIDGLAHGKVAGIAKVLFREIATFMGRALQYDDHTIMILKGAS